MQKQHRPALRAAQQGSQIIQLFGIIIIIMMASAIAIDFGYYYAEQNRLQTAADAAALAAVSSIYYDTSTVPNQKLTAASNAAAEMVEANQDGLLLGDDDVIFGFVDPTTKLYEPATFRSPNMSPDYALTGGYNAVHVRVRRGNDSPNAPLRTIMANMLGHQEMHTEASAVAFMDQSIDTITNGGVRPIYACENQFRQTMLDGIPENNVVRIYGDHIEVDGVAAFAGCPVMGSGNWGFADLRDCNPGSPGASTIEDWFKTGYPGTVVAGECYSTKPGNFISSISGTLDRLISKGTVFPIPLYDSFGGSGSNTHVNVSGFAGFKITAYKGNGPEASRYIEGRFTRFNCKTGCTSGNSGSGVVAPGGAVVKLRMASRS